MVRERDSSNVVIVAGDVTIDWNLARTRRDKSDGSAWNADDSTHAYWQRGGAALLADLVEQIAGQLPGRRYEVRQMAAPRDPLGPHERKYHHSYAIWSLFPLEVKPPLDSGAGVWRVAEFLGLDPCPGQKPQDVPPAEWEDWKKVVNDTADADLVILDDAALGFRDHRELWPKAVITPDRRPWVILKMARPVAQGALWEHLRKNHSERLVVVMTVNDLRRTEVQISRELSWERTAQDLAWELRHNPRVNALSRCAYVIILFETAGAFLLSGGALQAQPANGDASPRFQLFFDPLGVEGMWAQAYPGGMIGYTTCLAAGIARQWMLSPGAPDLARAIQSGLAAMHSLHTRGYGERGSTAPLANLAFPTKDIAAELARDDSSFAVAEVEDPVRFLTVQTPDPGTQAQEHFWSILQDRYTEVLGPVAEQIALKGATAALEGVPIGEFGKLLTVDRQEIESFRSIRALVHEYWRKDRQKPLSIAVFGAPGSGKSFGIVEVASAVLPKGIKVLQFNLSQFREAEDLLDALHQVRDVGLSGLMPLVFWDEFDTMLEGEPLGWLRHFLAPMQDGAFQQGQILHPVGRSIFVFAGGTSDSLGALAQLLPEEQFKAAKGPDFVSRLKGHINILGPNPQKGKIASDPYYVIRRALLLRSILDRDAPQLFQMAEGAKLLNVDRGVLRAFLQTRIYKHGVRSIESIVAMSLLAGKTIYERSSLPAGPQLDLHVEAQDFLALVQQIELEGELLEQLARAAHEVYCAGKERDGWKYGPEKSEAQKTHPLLVPYKDLPEMYKESNRVTVRTIPKKLAAAGYVMIPSRSNEPPFAFPGDALERLARFEHELWMKAKLADGWELGRPTPEYPKRNEYLVKWEQVPEGIKQIDRDLVKGIPQILSQAGYTIVKVYRDAAGGEGERE